MNNCHIKLEFNITIQEMENEYQEFVVKFSKTCYNVNKEFQKLNAQNKNRFIQEANKFLPASVLSLLTT